MKTHKIIVGKHLTAMWPVLLGIKIRGISGIEAAHTDRARAYRRLSAQAR